ncbi:hypothetical protein PHMEG_0009950 [Phytophthora megakarya]|uniref:Uncharacterized protein n=1 Tax=Phytophthora megakarya TaxID=4795 RepID=A0A225WGY8_9STRA|nr:hypothetical protein PHMEG_0009950 [Phytophthora megakarya]
MKEALQYNFRCQPHSLLKTTKIIFPRYHKPSYITKRCRTNHPGEHNPPVVGRSLGSCGIETCVNKIFTDPAPPHMGGTDRHDQLRLQRFSIQMVVRLKKYYHVILL